MIGIRKRIMVFDNEGTYTTMFKPDILKASGQDRPLQRDPDINKITKSCVIVYLFLL